ncbi:MAG: tetratricopeptide repeat protein [Terriglobales bacterium]
MKKSLVTLLLAFALGAAAQTTDQQQTPAAGGEQQSSQQTGQQAGQVTIKNPAEYNAYVTALQQTDPAAKAQALEAFLQQYPESVMKVPALELLMASYQQAGNGQKTVDAAQRLLQAQPNNLRALVVLTYYNRAAAEQGGANAQQALMDAGKYAEQGLRALQSAQKPADTPAADWDKLKSTATVIFNGAAGMAALQQKNYPQAAQYLQAAINSAPNDPSNNANVYPLAIADLEQNPMNIQGLFWVARAAAISNNNPAVVKYGKYKYAKYHGDTDGWDQLVAQAQASPTPPPNFSVAPAPTPAEQAGKLCQTKQVKDMSFDEFQMIFTSGNQQCADQVWSQIKDKPIAFEGKVIQTSSNELQLAATYDDIQNNVADVDLKFPVDIPKSLMPQVGSLAKVQGVPTSYDATPVPQGPAQGQTAAQGQQPATTGAAASAPKFMIHMDHGVFVGKKQEVVEKKTPAKKKTTVHRKK